MRICIRIRLLGGWLRGFWGVECEAFIDIDDVMLQRVRTSRGDQDRPKV